ncbi:hypothetical protein KFE98_00585 [bacterium SCSIO 12741]|nr:hypothetical protein KFE98_00585 [bacterium SCSIO 12741]
MVETGATVFYVKPKLQIGSQMYRPVFINKMDRQERWQGLVSWRMMRFAQPYVFFNKDFRSINDSYRYFPNLSDGEFSPQQDFHFTEVGVGVRYAFNEKYVRLNSTDVSMGTKAPVISAKYTRGIQGLLDGQFDYNRIDLKVSGQLRWRVLGRTQFCVTSGYIDTELPRTALFNAPATFGVIPIEVDRSFQTMRPNEFFSDQYSHLFFKHSFPKIRTGNESIQPVIVLYTNMGIGNLSAANQSSSPGLHEYDQGYYESGLGVDNIYSAMYVGIGLNAMYRYGPYALDYYLDNWALNLTFTFNLNFNGNVSLD